MNESSSPVPDLMRRLHTVSPYEDFPLSDYEKNISGWHSNSRIFRRLIGELKPSLVVEVGSWLGASAIEMATHMKTESSGGHILCVDTWLGAAEFWADKTDDRFKGLRLKNGYPQVYYQFLANVLFCGVQDIIVPFPQTSVNAARWLIDNALQADLVYVDASHEEMDVYEDIKAYWALIGPGGALFGDDYDEYWPGVVVAVNRFAEERKLSAIEDGGFWILRKPDPGSKGEGDSIEPVYGELAALRAENAIYRCRLLSIQMENAKLIAEKSALNVEAMKSETRAGFFFVQTDAAKAEAEKFRAENCALRTRLAEFQAEVESLRIENKG